MGVTKQWMPQITAIKIAALSSQLPVPFAHGLVIVDSIFLVQRKTRQLPDATRNSLAHQA